MTDEQKAAYVVAQAACLIAKVFGMQAENMQRNAQGYSMAYGEEAFQQAIADSGVHHNGCITLFHG